MYTFQSYRKDSKTATQTTHKPHCKKKICSTTWEQQASRAIHTLDLSLDLCPFSLLLLLTNPLWSTLSFSSPFLAVWTFPFPFRWLAEHQAGAVCSSLHSSWPMIWFGHGTCGNRQKHRSETSQHTEEMRAGGGSEGTTRRAYLCSFLISFFKSPSYFSFRFAVLASCTFSQTPLNSSIPSWTYDTTQWEQLRSCRQAQPQRRK